ncbi:transcriptional regulator, AraC family [Thalassoporum mexicanum PCC 7367]|uniref:AraC family transcriptional regulator n=1 Tax=Thalassoporum mexicanum TaxID=3457544 RepID=UPI00029FB395|nr:AraC family transcriptional regulator [Pseudanabaena sp. PCC 7367]AFY71455.1 transcriptional regulator, AraC family [Pseudanabaena sp. PCC 7367]
MAITHVIKDAKDLAALFDIYQARDGWADLQLFHCHEDDFIIRIPPYLGRGYRQYVQIREGLILAINNFEFYDDFTIEFDYVEAFKPVIPAGPNLVIDFFISQAHKNNHKYASVSATLSSFTDREANVERLVQYSKGNKTFEIELTVSGALLEEILTELGMELLWPEGFDQKEFSLKSLQLSQQRSPLINQPSNLLQWRLHSTLGMQQVIQQILDCPHQGTSRRFYLESKALELITQWLEQTIYLFKQQNESTEANPAINLDAIEQIYAARQILVSQFVNPPSLNELARQVGLNRRKLSEGFQQLFKATPFVYLQHYRLEQAQQLLHQPDIKIAAVAKQLGYRNPSKFTIAFKKQFGVNPKTYQQQYLAKNYVSERQ